MRQRHDRALGRLATSAWALLALAGTAFAQPTSPGSAIVDEVLKDATQQQTRDSERVRRMVDEAIKGAEQAPSGIEAVNPTAPDTLRPTEDVGTAVLPAGFAPEDLEDKPVRDGTGAEIGRLRGLAVDQASQQLKVMVQFAPLFGHPAKTAAFPIEQLRPADSLGDGYVVEITPVDYEALPAYAWRDGEWRRSDA